MREELEKAVTSGAGKGRGAGSELPNPSDFDNLLSPDASGEGRGEDYYSSMEQQRQLELMQEQDEQLDGVFRTVGNLRQQADDMGRELEEQGVMLDEVDTLADRVGGKLQNGLRRVKHIVRKNEGKLCASSILIIKLRYLKLTNNPETGRYNVFLLHSRPDLRAHTITHLGDCHVIYNGKQRGFNDFSTTRGYSFKGGNDSVASLLARSLLLIFLVGVLFVEFIIIDIVNVEIRVEILGQLVRLDYTN